MYAVIVCYWNLVQQNDRIIGKNMNYFHRNKILTSLLIALLFQIMIGSFSSVRANTPENFLLHTDRSVYLTGETIWYKIYNTNYQEHSDHSKVVYINLHGKNGVLLFQQKVHLVEGKAHGSITIPLSWNEDYYYLTCFTKWNLQFEKDQLEAKIIAVYNPYENTNEESALSTSKEKPQVDFIQGNVKIEMQKKDYARREQGSVRIATTDGQKGTISVAIHYMDALEKITLSSVRLATNQSTLNLHYEIEKQSEKEQKLQIDGKAFDPITDDPINSDVFSLYKVGGDTFYRISSGDGHIHTSIDDFNGSAIFQLFNMNPYQPSLPNFTQIRPGENLIGIELKNTNPPHNIIINDYLKNARLNRKVQEIFEERTLDSLQNKQIVSTPFVADKVYKMEKFKSMKTLEEFIREIVTFAELSVKDNKTTVRLKNTETQRFFMEKPWYLVDGYLTRDEEAVLSIPFKNLTRVELFITNKSILSQLETVMVRSGLIAVYTNDYSIKDAIEAQKNIFTFDGFSQASSFEEIKHSSPQEARENPDFKSLIYWNPEVKLNSTAELEFVTSDLLGKYMIEVSGLTDDGKILSGLQVFSVSY